MEKILVIAEIYPFPYDTGGKLRTANIIIQLSNYFEIDFICHSLDSVSTTQINEAKKYCSNIDIIVEKRPSKLRKGINLFLPTCNAEYIVHSSKMNEIVKSKIQSNTYKFALVERLYAYQYIRKCIKFAPPVYIDMHDIEREAMNYFSKIATNLLQKKHYKIEVQKVKALELEAVKNSKGMIAVSKRDCDLYASYFPKYEKEKWIAVNNGIDLRKTELAPKVKRDSQTVIFVGSLRHPPNLHGLRWFVKEVWPLVLRRFPKAKFVIVGSGEISEEDRELFNNTEGAVFKGFVENLYPLLREATCLVVPLFSGSGTRLKILEAFSFELPVISTTVGAEGLPYVDGKHLLIADDVNAMLEKMGYIFNHEDKAKLMSDCAFQLVSAEYNWEHIIKKLVKQI